MNLIPWKERTQGLDIFHNMEDIQKEMNRLFDFTLRPLSRTGNGGPGWLPDVDIVDEKDSIRVTADLPGMKRDEIDVAVEDDVLTIKGEKKQFKEIKNKDYIRAERYYGAFHRSFTLPSSVDAGKVQASYRDGILEITLPKKEGTRTKQIKIDVK
jgi:HSP20 family protein